MRLGVAAVLIGVQVGEAAVPLVVRKMLPLLCPTSMKLELPGEISIALMRELVPVGGLIAVQAGGAPGGGGKGPLTLLFRHRLMPPASKVFGSLGSRASGAMKFVVGGLLLPTSPIPALIEVDVTPPSVLRTTPRFCVSP